MADLMPLSALAQQFEDAANPNTCIGLVDTANLDQDVKDAITRFRRNLQTAGVPSDAFQITSGYRPMDYQAHIFEVATKYQALYDALSNVNGITAVKAGNPPRPQLQINPNVPERARVNVLSPE